MGSKTPPSLEALSQWISDRSVALLLSPQDGGLYVGSAVPVELCGHYFLATVAHNLQGISSRDQLRALPSGRRLERALRILDWHAVRETTVGEVDTAWLEVEVVSAAACSSSFLPAASLLCGITHREDTVFFVHGYPEKSVDQEDVAEEVPLLGSVGLATYSIRPNESTCRYQQGVDFLVQWPPPDLGQHKAKLPEPAGVSGGGVWLLPRYRENPAWTLSDLRVVALTRAWRRHSRELVTTRVEHWLTLVAEDHPFTRKEVEPLLERGRAGK